MPKPVTGRDLLWGYAASALNIGVGLILLPITLRYLSAEDVGLWIVFVTLASLAQLLEMGFQPTLARNAAYVYSGAQKLYKEGLPGEVCLTGKINKPLLDTLVSSARRIYQVVAIIAALILLLAGTLYISTLLTPNQPKINSLIAWIAFASGYVLNFYYGYINGILQGRGDVSQANKVVIITRSLMILLGGSAVALGSGIIGLGIASMLAAAVGRIAAHRFFYAGYMPSGDITGKELLESQKEIVKILWHNASKMGVAQLGAFLIQRGNILIASSSLGLAVAASYSITITILITLAGISMVLSQLQVPLMSAMQAKNDRKSLAAIYGQILILGWITYGVGLALLLNYGPHLLYLLGSKTSLPPNELMFALGIIFLLEVNHSIAATYLSTTNKIPFVNAAILSGAAILLGSIMTVPYLGLAGIIFIQGLVQLSYNNWKWPAEALKNIGFSLWSVLILGSKRMVNVSR